jgi:hypothetical protein
LHLNLHSICNHQENLVQAFCNFLFEENSQLKHLHMKKMMPKSSHYYPNMGIQKLVKKMLPFAPLFAS